MQEKVDDLFALRDSQYADGDVKLSDEELGMLVTSMFQRYYGSNIDAEPDEGGDRPTEPEAEAEAEPDKPSASTPPRPRSGRRSPRSSSKAASGKRSRSSTSSRT